MDKQAEEMEIKAGRIAAARALATIGLNAIAVELSLPRDVDPDSELLMPSEAQRARSSRTESFARAAEEARAHTLGEFTDHGNRIEVEKPGLPCHLLEGGFRSPQFLCGMARTLRLLKN